MLLSQQQPQRADMQQQRHEMAHPTGAAPLMNAGTPGMRLPGQQLLQHPLSFGGGGLTGLPTQAPHQRSGQVPSTNMQASGDDLVMEKLQKENLILRLQLLQQQHHEQQQRQQQLSMLVQPQQHQMQQLQQPHQQFFQQLPSPIASPSEQQQQQRQMLLSSSMYQGQQQLEQQHFYANPAHGFPMMNLMMQQQQPDQQQHQIPQHAFIPVQALAMNPRPVFPSQFDQEVKRRGAQTTSSYRGVYWNKNCRAWRARIWVNGKSEHLGNFNDEEEAARAFDKRASELNRISSLNFPNDSIRDEFVTRRKDNRALKKKPDSEHTEQSPSQPCSPSASTDHNSDSGESAVGSPKTTTRKKRGLEEIRAEIVAMPDHKRQLVAERPSEAEDAEPKDKDSGAAQPASPEA